MNKVQKGKMNMFIAISLFFVKNALTFATYIELVNQIAGFSSSLNDLNDEIAIQSKFIGGVTTTKHELLQKAIKLTVKSARKARAWAKITGNATLEGIFDVTISTFSEMSQSVVLNALKVIRDKLSDNIANLTIYKVVAIDVTKITDAITAATPVIGTPNQARGERVIASQEIVAGIIKCDDYLLLIDDMLIPEYEDTNESMVNEYRLAREMQPIGTHHTGVHATCRNSITKDILEGVLLTIVELKKSAVSDIDGVAEIERMKPGKYHLLFTKEGYLDYSIIVEFGLGKMQTIEAMMIRKEI